MRSILIIVITLSLILGAGFYTISEVSGTAEVLLSHCIRIRSDIEGGQWEDARHRLKEFDTFWNDSKPVWTILINHKEIDNIDMALVKINEYLKSGEKGLALGEVASLELLIRHIPEKEKVTLENIF
ncbi:MAG: DUF4363 family protein [Bacillota bacterium]|jgi:hypothetical protein|nr:DUF4363 family protein [Bacillota bacterium]MDD3298454.1 DUF4363 family protein [Bacillota bacterium]MDD3850781.1 DUF4363 family protein [Bacillota bacterium]MDD4707304.1 DUF4363 family protein [Bacillota bacterium]